MELVVISWPHYATDRWIHSSWRNLTNYLDMHVPGWSSWRGGQHEHDMRNHINNVLIKYNGKIKGYNTFQVVFEFASEEDLTLFVLTWS